MSFSLEETLESVGQKMVVDFDELSRQVKHRGLRGRIREITVVRDFLSPRLPKQLELATGEIVSSDGSVSRQMDVVVFDGLKCPVFLKAEEVHILPVEGVYAVIEVKSKLDKLGLEDSIEKTLSVKAMPKKAFVAQTQVISHHTSLYGHEYSYFPTIGCCFAYDASCMDDVLQRLNEANTARGIPLDRRIDTVCVLRKGVITNWREERVISLTPTPDSHLVYIATDKALLLFYLLLMTTLNQAWMPPINLVEYAGSVAFGPAYRYM